MSQETAQRTRIGNPYLSSTPAHTPQSDAALQGITTISSRHRVLDSVLNALMEYSKLTLPVLLYVALEALHHQGSAFLLTSPEWGIATVFLAIHGPGLCEDEIERSGHGISALRMRFFRSLGLLLAAAALINSFLSFDNETGLKVLVRLTLFCFASFAFVLVVGAARYRALRMTSTGRLGRQAAHAQRIQAPTR